MIIIIFLYNNKYVRQNTEVPRGLGRSSRALRPVFSWPVKAPACRTKHRIARCAIRDQTRSAQFAPWINLSNRPGR